MNFYEPFTRFLSTCKQIENLSINLHLTKYVEGEFQIWYRRDGVPIQIDSSGFDNFFEFSCCVNHITSLPIKSLVINYCNRNKIDDCDARIARCINRFFREHIHRLECLWAPISFKDYFVLSDPNTGDFNRMVVPNQENRITWVCMK